MKTYLLKNTPGVEPKARRQPRLQNLTAPTAGVSSPGSSPGLCGPVLFIGMDVHNDSIAVSLAPSDSTEVRRYGIIGGSHDDVLKLCRRLQGAHPDAALKFCYEAGPRGYPLCRFLRGHGHECILVAPSKVPRKPGDRVKTDRRDAVHWRAFTGRGDGWADCSRI